MGMKYYGVNEMPGYSVPATEHSIMTSLGIDALYDRSNDAFAIYNVNILKIK